MVDIYYPSPSTSKAHVRSYFLNTPAATSHVLGHEFASSLRAGGDAFGAIGTYIYSKLYDDNFLTVDQWKESEYFREGVDIGEEGVAESTAQSLAAAYDRRIGKDLVLSRAKSGLGLARFGTQIVGSVLDPVNIGSAFLAPAAVGLNAAARTAAIKTVSGITSRYGMTAGRVAAGAGEATIGAAMVEPIMFAGEQLQQNPYTLYDSFINLTAGAILGGAVTGIGGKFSDIFTRADSETVLQSLRVAVSDLVDGRPVNVRPILDADPNVSPKINSDVKAKETRRTTTLTATATPKPNELPPSLKRAYQKNSRGEVIKPKTLIQFVKDAGRIDPDSPMAGDVKARLDKGGFGVLKRGGVGLDEMARRAQEAGYFPGRLDTDGDRVTPEELVAALENDQFRNDTFSYMDSDAEEYLAALQLDETVSELGIDPRGMTDEELFQEIEMRQNALSEDEAAQLEASKGPGISRAEFDEAVAQVDRYYNEQGDLEEFLHPMEELDDLDIAHQQTVQSEDARITAFDREIAVLEQQVAGLRANNLLNEEDLAELDEWGGVVSRADESEEIINAGAVCVVNNSRAG